MSAESGEGRRFHLKVLPASFQKTSRTSVLIKVLSCSKCLFIGWPTHYHHTAISQEMCIFYLYFHSAAWERSKNENVGLYSSVYLWNEQMSHFSSVLILFSESTDWNWCLTVIFSQTKTSIPLCQSVCQQRLAQTAIFNAAFDVSVLLPREK